MARRRAVSAPSRDTLAVVGASWSRHLRAEGKSPQTTSTYLKAIHGLADYLPPDTAAAAIRKDDLVDWLNYLRDERGYRPATLSQRYRSIQQMFRYLVSEGDIDHSPLDGLSPPRIPDTPPPVLTLDQMAALLDAVRGTSFADRRDTAIIRTFLATGIRRGEMAGIRLADLDLDREALQVTGKGGHTRRVTFGKKATQALDRYLRVRSSHKAAPETGLWLGERGVLSQYGIEQTVKRAAIEAGLPWVSCHTFRHSFAAHSLDLGMHEGDLASLAGWKSNQMVQRYGRAVRHDRAMRSNRENNAGDLV